jgi:hypothetical protein
MKKLAAIFALSALSFNLQAQDAQSDTKTVPNDTVKTEVAADTSEKKLPFLKTKKHDGRFSLKAGTEGVFLTTDRFGPFAEKIHLQSVRGGLLNYGFSGSSTLGFNLWPVGGAVDAPRFGSGTTVLGLDASFGTPNLHIDPIIGVAPGKGFVYGTGAGADFGTSFAPIHTEGAVLFGTKANQSEISSPFQYYLQGSMPSPIKFEPKNIPASVHKFNTLTAGIRSYTQEKDQDIPMPAGVPGNLSLNMHTSTRYTRLFVENEMTVAHLGKPDKGTSVSLMGGAYYQTKSQVINVMNQPTAPEKTKSVGVEAGAFFDFQKSAAKGGGSSKYRAGLVVGKTQDQTYVQLQLRRNLHVKR